MRAWIGVFSLSAIGSTGFAVSELQQLKHHTPMVVQMPAAQPVVAVAAVVFQAPPPPVTPPALSTWRGPTPFGSVAVADDADENENDIDSDDEGEGIPDVEDRCPDDGEGDDEDGCPDVQHEPLQRIVLRSEPEEVVINVDGEERRRIILERSEIIIY
jgi:hypothetical protein